MLISEIIEHLTKLHHKHGDLPMYSTHECGTLHLLASDFNFETESKYQNGKIEYPDCIMLNQY